MTVKLMAGGVVAAISLVSQVSLGQAEFEYKCSVVNSSSGLEGRFFAGLKDDERPFYFLAKGQIKCEGYSRGDVLVTCGRSDEDRFKCAVICQRDGNPVEVVNEQAIAYGSSPLEISYEIKDDLYTITCELPHMD